MELYLLKRMHHEGQTIYGIFESKDQAMKQLPTLKKNAPSVPVSEYFTIKVSLNELVEIDSHDE